MFAIATKKIFTACAARLAKSITVNDAVSIFKHFLHKDGSKWAKTLAQDITHYTEQNEASMNVGVDKTRAANWLSKSLSGEDYNATSAKLKSYKPVDLSTQAGVATARDTIVMLEEYLYSQEHYEDTFKSIIQYLSDDFSFPFGTNSDGYKDFDLKHPTNSCEQFLAQLNKWAKSDTFAYLTTEGMGSPSDYRGSSTDWNKTLNLVTKDGVNIAITIDYTDYEDSGLDDFSINISVNDVDIEDLLLEDNSPDDIYEPLQELMVQYFGSSSTYERDICPLECFDIEGINQSFQLLNSAVKVKNKPVIEMPVLDESIPTPEECLQMLRPNGNRKEVFRVYINDKPVSAFYYDQDDNPEDMAKLLDGHWGDMGHAYTDGKTVRFAPNRYGFLLGFAPNSLVFYDASRTNPFNAINPVAVQVELQSGHKINLPLK